jgi:hypothetical protein
MRFQFALGLVLLLILLAFINLETFDASKEPIGQPYCSSNISKYEVGSPNVKNVFNYWQNLPLLWAAQYSNVSKDVTHVHSNRGKHLPYRPTLTKGVDPAYYHDPSNYKGTMFYPETYTPHQEPVDKVSTANNRVIEGLHYNGIAILKPLPL